MKDASNDSQTEPCVPNSQSIGAGNMNHIFPLSSVQCYLFTSSNDSTNYKISFHPQPCLLFPYIDINPIFFQTTPVPNLRIAINFHPDFIILSISKTHVTNLPQSIIFPNALITEYRTSTEPKPHTKQYL